MQAPSSEESLPALVTDHLEIFQCPACGADLELRAPAALACRGCDRGYTSEDGVPLLFASDRPDTDEITQEVKSFYEETPFPNYEDIDSQWSLRDKAEQRVFARQLDEHLGRDALALEVGCGTGQLSNYLGLGWNRTVFGADMCMNSLRLGNGFRRKNEIANTAFLQMNLLRPAFKPGSFDMVVSNGVLLTTREPFAGFQSISKLVKPGGHIVIGLYNTWGRLTTDLRRVIFRLTGDRFQFLDPHLRNPHLSEGQRKAWFMDQYKHPSETKQTYGEVQGWFEQCGFEFVNAIPKATAFGTFSRDETLFQKQPRGGAFDHFLVQGGMLLTGGREGGFFVMVGRRTG